MPNSLVMVVIGSNLFDSLYLYWDHSGQAPQHPAGCVPQGD